MSAERIRGGAGLVFAILGALLLLRGAPGLSANAAAGCKDDDTCYAETRTEAYMDPNSRSGGGWNVTSYTATCQGDCLPGQDCEPITSENPDGSTTYQCSCDPNVSPAACSGFVTVEANGSIRSMTCLGSCGTLQCKKLTYNHVFDQWNPSGGSFNRRCVCE